jgi:hypothetical protein
MFTTHERGSMNEETRLVCDFLEHDDTATDLFRNAARHFFRSPYRRDAVERVRHMFANNNTFDSWAIRYVSGCVRPTVDPGHDANAMLRCGLIAQSLERVDWGLIERAWHDWAEGECRINGICLS